MRPPGSRGPITPRIGPNKFQPIPWVYCEIVRHLSQVEDVHILVNDEDDQRRALNMLRRQGGNARASTSTAGAPTASGCATPAPSSSRIPQAKSPLTNWKFNAWAKYDNWRNDDLIPKHVAKLYGMKSFEPEL